MPQSNIPPATGIVNTYDGRVAEDARYIFEILQQTEVQVDVYIGGRVATERELLPDSLIRELSRIKKRNPDLNVRFLKNKPDGAVERDRNMPLSNQTASKKSALEHKDEAKGKIQTELSIDRPKRQRSSMELDVDDSDGADRAIRRNKKDRGLNKPKRRRIETGPSEEGVEAWIDKYDSVVSRNTGVSAQNVAEDEAIRGLEEQESDTNVQQHTDASTQTAKEESTSGKVDGWNKGRGCLVQ